MGRRPIIVTSGRKTRFTPITKTVAIIAWG
jgi:hypothetical protein